MSLQDLQKSEDKWVTRMGKVFPTEKAIFRGKDLHKELKDLSWFELFLYGITGRFFTENQLKMLNFIWTSTSYPDPRIWNNRVAALAGSVKSTVGLGVGAAIAISEADIYGPGAMKQALMFLMRLSEAISKGGNTEHFINQELNSGRKIYGYGRALVESDERIPHVVSMASRLGIARGRLFSLAFEVENILKSKKGLSMNVGALYGAIPGDMGFSPHELTSFLTPIFSAGMFPCYIEASEKPMGTLFPLKCSRVVYVGHSPRRRLVTATKKANMGEVVYS